MEPGTKFCIDHPDIKIPEYAEECPICNKQVVRHDPFPTTYPGGSFQSDEVKALDPKEEEVVMKRLAELDEPEPPRPFKEFREKIEAKIQEKLAAKKAKK